MGKARRKCFKIIRQKEITLIFLGGEWVEICDEDTLKNLIQSNSRITKGVIVDLSDALWFSNEVVAMMVSLGLKGNRGFPVIFCEASDELKGKLKTLQLENLLNCNQTFAEALLLIASKLSL